VKIQPRVLSRSQKATLNFFTASERTSYLPGVKPEDKTPENPDPDNKDDEIAGNDDI